MSLTDILKYQDEDMKLIALDKELSQSEPFKKFRYLSNENTGTQEELKAVIRKVQESYLTIDQFKSTIEKTLAEVKDLAVAAQDFEELKEVDLYEKKVAQLQKYIDQVDRDINRIDKEITANNQAAVNAYTKLRNINSNAEIVKKDCEVVRESQKVRRVEITANLKALESTVPADLLKKYNDVRKQNKTPVIVEFKESFCQGCNMEVDRNVSDSMRSGTIGECPNCGRLIYKL